MARRPQVVHQHTFLRYFSALRPAGSSAQKTLLLRTVGGAGALHRRRPTRSRRAGRSRHPRRGGSTSSRTASLRARGSDGPGGPDEGGPGRRAWASRPRQERPCVPGRRRGRVAGDACPSTSWVEYRARSRTTSRRSASRPPAPGSRSSTQRTGRRFSATWTSWSSPRATKAPRSSCSRRWHWAARSSPPTSPESARRSSPRRQACSCRRATRPRPCKRAIGELADDPARRVELGQEAHEEVASTRYRLDTMLERTVAILEGALRA